MGTPVAAAVRSGGARTLWCPNGRGPATATRAASVGLEAVESLDALVTSSDVILSICPPVAAEEVAAEVADRRFDGLFVEANAVDPNRLHRIAERITAVGARVVDGALFGPRHDGDATRLYLSGASADVRAVRRLFDGSGVRTTQVDGGVGQASALKMAHSTFQKSARALAALAYALAARHGVVDHLLAEADGLESALAQPERLPGVAARAWRWVPELRDAAETLVAAGLPAALADGAAEVLARWEPDRDADGLTLDAVLARLRSPIADR